MQAQIAVGKYGFSKVVDFSYDEAIQRTKQALKEEGFGVLSEIDVQNAMKEKLGLHYPKYLILGACNPHLAHQALQIEPDLGLLLPCNVVIQEKKEKIEISIMNAEQMLAVVGNEKLATIAKQANEKLKHALNAI